MNLADIIPGYNPDPYEKLVDGLHTALGDGDAIALLPYDDGTFFMKRAYFDKQLIGGIGGYETDDGDKIAVDGTGEAVRELFGVPIVLGVDPTEHAAAVDPIKALVAHKNDIGEWLRVDKQGQVVQIGPALRPAPSIAEAADVEAAMQAATPRELLESTFQDFDPERIQVPERVVIDELETRENDALLGRVLDDYDPEEHSEDEKELLVGEHEDAIRDWLRVELERQNAQTLVDEHEPQIREAVREYLEQPPMIQPDGVVADGGLVGDFMRGEYLDGAPGSITFDDALVELAERGDVTKVYDIAPPAAPVQDPDGNVEVETATHIAVDQSKAADLLPTTWDTVEINTALDRARMEEYEEGRLMKYLTYGIIIGAVGTIAVVIVMFLMMSISGGVF